MCQCTPHKLFYGRRPGLQDFSVGRRTSKTLTLFSSATGSLRPVVWESHVTYLYLVGVVDTPNNYVFFVCVPKTFPGQPLPSKNF